MSVLVATGTRVLRLAEGSGALVEGEGAAGRRPTCLAADPLGGGRAWCGTRRDGVLRTEDGGRSWRPAGLADEHVTALAASPATEGLVWAGTEPSRTYRSEDGGSEWTAAEPLDGLPSASEWSFPPKPDTHHVRWIAPHPADPGRLWVAVEAGALVTTTDGGRSWRDRVPGGPRDTHELAVHPDRPETLRVAAGDGYFESEDGGRTWSNPDAGLEVGYLRSVAVDPGDPDRVLVSGASRARTAYVAGRADGRLYRRAEGARWERVRDGWPRVAETIAPLLAAGAAPGTLYAADERGVHRTDDGGATWRRVAAYDEPPGHLRGLVVLRPRDGPP